MWSPSMWSTWSVSGRSNHVLMPHILHEYSTFPFWRIAESFLWSSLCGPSASLYASNLSLSCSVTAVFLSVV